MDNLRYTAASPDPSEGIRATLAAMAGAALGIPPSEITVVVDFLDSRQIGQGPPPLPPILPSEQRARMARREALDQAHAERLARKQVGTIAIAWRSQRDVNLELLTDDGGYTYNRVLVSDEVMYRAPEALSYHVNMAYEQLLRRSDELIRQQLKWPAHLR